MKAFTIGNAAREAGIGIDTVRFYEREGLIDPPDRTASGYRLYTADTVSRLRFIRRTKALGFSLKEIKELLSLSHDPSATKADVKERTEAKIADIEARIRDLRSMKEVLEHLSASCDGQGPVEECPILRALDDDGVLETHGGLNREIRQGRRLRG